MIYLVRQYYHIELYTTDLYHTPENSMSSKQNVLN